MRFIMFKTLPAARHAGDSSDHEDDGQYRKYEDVEHGRSPYTGARGYAEMAWEQGPLIPDLLSAAPWPDRHR